MGFSHQGLSDSVESMLEQQIEIMETSVVSLHSLWRAAGSPDGFEPEGWLDRALPLIEGIVEYLVTIPGRPSTLSGEHPLIQRWRLDDRDPWRHGDLIVHQILARIYAIFLSQATSSPI